MTDSGQRLAFSDPQFSQDDLADAAQVVSLLAPVVPVLAAALRPRTEVILHDLTRIPETIAAIGGSITGRSVGGPPTDLGLQHFRSGWQEHLIGYRTETAEGTPLRSSSIFFHARSGRAVATLCINTDISGVLKAQETLASLAHTTELETTVGGPAAQAEHFPSSVDQLADGLLRATIAEADVPVDLMKKAHKLNVVRELQKRGFFAIRDGVDLAAQRLKVSRYTVYNYINEIQAEEGPGKP
ncbi:transcriptional regulator [Streptomyces sp. NPDC059373]